jgi:hypothetical protein
VHRTGHSSADAMSHGQAHDAASTGGITAARVARIRNSVAHPSISVYPVGAVMRRVVLALLALAVFLPSLADARARWMPDVDLYVRDQCCCPPRRTQPPPAQSSLKKACCKIEKRTATALPLASTSPVPPAVAAASTRIVATAVMPPLRVAVIAVDARAQAPPLTTLLAQARGLLL